MPEGRGIFANLTVHENLELGAYLRKDTEIKPADYERVFALFPRAEGAHQAERRARFAAASSRCSRSAAR